MYEDLIAKCREIVKCDTARISKPGDRMFCIIGFTRNTKDDPGQFIKNGERFDFDYVQEKVIASGHTDDELIENVKEYQRLCGITWEQYFTEIGKTFPAILYPTTHLLGEATTVGQMRKLLEKYADNISFGFRNQPMQTLYEVLFQDLTAVIFQPEITYNSPLAKSTDNKYLSLDEYLDDDDEDNVHLKKWELSKQEKINNVVDQIMLKYGPDRQCDGSELITKFIIKLINSTDEERENLLQSVNLDDFI